MEWCGPQIKVACANGCSASGRQLYGTSLSERLVGPVAGHLGDDVGDIVSRVARERVGAPICATHACAGSLLGGALRLLGVAVMFGRVRKGSGLRRSDTECDLAFVSMYTRTDQEKQMDTQPPPDGEPRTADAMIDPPRLRDWLWRPWYAKFWWATVPIYWGGRMASIKVTDLASFYETLAAGYLAVFCNPFITLLVLGLGFIRSKLDRGEWVITPGVPVWTQRKPGEMLDPTLDSTDPRSGVRHLRHIGVLKDGVH